MAEPKKPQERADSKMESTTRPVSKDPGFGDIVTLNVGGRKFSTSRQTLTWIPDSFFSSLMSGRIPSLKDETGAIFIDRDPDAFIPILHYLRTKNVDFRNIDLVTLKQEAGFYGVIPLVKRLAVCEEAESGCCGNILFYGMLQPAVFDMPASLDCSPLPKVQLALKIDFTKQVIQLTGHGSYLAVAYNHCICVLGVRESRGWEVVFITPALDKPPQRIAVTSRSVGHGLLGGPLLAVVLGFEVKVWSCLPQSRILASFDMKIPVDGLFFTGIQLAVISNTGRVAIWQSVQQHWQKQEVAPICSYDTGSSFLLLGCSNGSIYYIDMEKFPVRMKDNDLLVTEMFEDPNREPITALSVFCSPSVFAGSGQNWMEVAYGTQTGRVVVVVRHPENIGQAPQIFQCYHVHTCPILRVVLGEKHLISVCGENHVRTWTVTRFRGRISTQPGSVPIASFKVLSLEGPHSLFYPINSIGPFGDLDEDQVFVQRIIPETEQLFVRLSSDGKRVCKIKSVDGSNISTYCVHECEAANRIGLRSRRFIFTGHTNGAIQIWDLTTALELSKKNPDPGCGGPSQSELLQQLQNCEISGSRVSSAVSSRAPSPSPSLMSIMFPGMKQQAATPIPIKRSIGGLSTNLFQPIRRNSTTSSNLSISAAANATLQTSTSFTIQTPQGRVDGAGRGVGDEWREVEQTDMEHSDVGVQTSLNAGEDTTEENLPETKSSAASVGFPVTRSSSDGSELKVKKPKARWNATLVHQRSRSNEIDYSLSENRASSVSIQTSPDSCGNVQAFRPVSVCSVQTGCSVLSNSLTSASAESRHSGSNSNSSSGTVLMEPSRTFTPVLQTEDNSQQTGTVSSDSISYWSREFATMSDYFGANDSDSRNEVTDC